MCVFWFTFAFVLNNNVLIVWCVVEGVVREILLVVGFSG